MSHDTQQVVVVFEGYDGTGKSTLAKHVSKEYGFSHLAGLPPNFASRRHLFDETCTGVTQRAAFYADANIAQSARIGQKLTDGNDVVLERYYWSTLATHDLPVAAQETLHDMFRLLRQPDLWFYVQADLEKILDNTRHRQARGLMTPNDVAMLTPERYARTRARYEKLAKNSRCAIIDGNGTLDEMKEQVAGWMKLLI